MNEPATISLIAHGIDAIEVAAIPDELKDRTQWVLWRYEHRPGQHKPTKIPYNARRPNRRADATNPATWSPFALVVARYIANLRVSVPKNSYLFDDFFDE